MKLLKSTRKITHLTNEEIIYNFFVKTGKLEIDKQGRVWRNCTGKHTHKGRIRAERINEHGDDRRPTQVYVREYLNNKPVSCTASRLVYLALKGRIPHLKVVAAKDGDKTNTHPKNLFLCTQGESVMFGHQRAA